MKEDFITLKLRDESSNVRKVPVSIIRAEGHAFAVVRVILEEEYGLPFQLPIQSCPEIFLHFGDPLNESQKFVQSPMIRSDHKLNLEGIESADLIIFGGGPGRVIKSMLKNVEYRK